MAHRDYKSHIYYDVYPKVVLADSESCIFVRPVAKQGFGCSIYWIVIYAMEDNTKKIFTINSDNEVLKIKHFFKGEQEHSIYVYENEISEYNELCILHLYSLQEDLYHKRPYKGDFHLHSTCSDGNEIPTSICALARKAGLDFMAITDHRKYQPSIDAQTAFADSGSDLAIFPGEEVHFHGREHIVSYGAKEGLGEKYSDKDLFLAELESFTETISEEINNLPKNINKNKYAACRFAIEKIRNAGGLGIIAHPHWIVEDGYHNAGNLFKYMYENKTFDVFELINGSICEESNNLQAAFYQQQRALGNNMPIVSGSDSHTVVFNKYFGKMYTIVLSEDIKFSSIRKNVLNGFTAIVDETLPYVYGSYRMVKYARYLMREIFPLHDDICYEEGRLMQSYITSNDVTKERLQYHKGSIKKLYDKLWQ